MTVSSDDLVWSGSVFYWSCQYILVVCLYAARDINKYRYVQELHSSIKLNDLELISNLFEIIIH